MQAPSEQQTESAPAPVRPVFKCKHGHEWNLELTVGAVEDVQRATGFDLDAAIADTSKLVALITHTPRKLAEILWVLCEDQAKARDITPGDFGRSLTREAIDGAADALIAAIVLFYPRASAGKALAEALPAVLAKMDRETSAAVRKALSNLPTN